MALRKQKHIALLGLAANPPHLGHLWLAKQILEKGVADEIWLIPTFHHCLKHKLWPWRHRWNMTKLMERKYIKAYNIESRLEPPSYTFQTVKFLRKKFRAHKFSWIVGSDIFRKGEIDTWDKWHSYLKKNINFLVVPRPGYLLAKDCGNLTKNFKIIKLPYSRARWISSTQIRERLKKGLSIKGLVTFEVERYIKKWFNAKTQKWIS